MSNESCEFSDMAKLAERFQASSHNLSYVDKFDTALILEPWIKLSENLAIYTSWEKVPHKVTAGFIFGEDIELLQTPKYKISPETLIHMKINPLIPSLIINDILNLRTQASHIKNREFKDLTSTMVTSARCAFEHQLSHLLSHTGPNFKEQALVGLEVWDEKLLSLPTEIIKTIHVVEDFNKVIEIHKKVSRFFKGKNRKAIAAAILKETPIIYVCHSVDATVLITRSVTYWKFKGCTWLVPKIYLLEIHNKVTELQSMLLFNHFQSNTSMPHTHYKLCVEFLILMTDHVIQFDSANPHNLEFNNKGFVYLKAIEGIGVAEIIKRSYQDKGWDNDSLQHTLWTSLYNEGLVKERSYNHSSLHKLLSRMCISSIADLIGTIKICGHPSIEILRGLTKLNERVHATINVDTKMVASCKALATRDLCKQFYKKKGYYPNLTVGAKAPIALKSLVQRKISPISDEGRTLLTKITTDDWLHIKIGKNAEFDPVDNQLSLLKDKALGLTRSKVIKQLVGETYKRNKAESRALLVYLFSSIGEMNHKPYLEKYMHANDWNLLTEYLVIKLTAKELEEKPEGRMFGASPSEERMRRIIQEPNAMKVMDDYMPDQLLTPNELTIMKKLFSFRHLQYAYPNHTILNISFDFSKWNNNMRHESVDVGAGALLDDWFGINMYSKTMTAYHHMLVYYDDRTFKIWWDGQLGGIEGLNQATWSVGFLAGMKRCLENIGYKYQITVKGDDVRAAMIIPNRDLKSITNPQGDDINTFKDRLLEEIRVLCVKMGWELNPQESFSSLSLIATSKQYQVNECWLPTVSKKIMKIESLTNIIYPTIEDTIASVFSIAHSACGQATVIFPCYLTALCVAAKIISRWLIRVMNHNTDDLIERTCVCLLWPQILGGMGSLPIQTFFVRGENDMLSISLSLLRHLYHSPGGNIKMKAYIKAILDQPLATDPNKSLL